MEVYKRVEVLPEADATRLYGDGRLVGFSQRAKDVHVALARHRKVSGDGDFTVPTEVLMKMLGYEFEDVKEFNRRVLKVEGRVDTDFKPIPVPLIFKSDKVVAFTIPGTNETITWTRPEGRGNHKFYWHLPGTFRLAGTCLYEDIRISTVFYFLFI